jgi:hypothetical protein
MCRVGLSLPWLDVSACSSFAFEMTYGVAILSATISHDDPFAFKPKVAARHLGIEKVCNPCRLPQRGSTGVEQLTRRIHNAAQRDQECPRHRAWNSTSIVLAICLAQDVHQMIEAMSGARRFGGEIAAIVRMNRRDQRQPSADLDSVSGEAF